MRLSPHFTLEELTRSQTAVRKGIDNTPSDTEIENLTVLCIDFLEVIRKELGQPIIISSGFRCKELNTAIGGSETSSHIFGEAVDFRVIGYKPISTCKIIASMGLKYDQLIHEFGRWIHLGIGPRRRIQNLTAYKEDGKTKYIHGLYKIKELTDAGGR
jgi:uncharacterized protein YcbK (DUF882 family)